MRNIILSLRDRIKTFFSMFSSAIMAKIAANGYKSNVFTPIAAFITILVIVLFAVALRVQNETMQWLLVGFALFLVLFAVIIYVVILYKDPTLLQSERFKLENRKIDVIMVKGQNQIPIDPITLKLPETSENA